MKLPDVIAEIHRTCVQCAGSVANSNDGHECSLDPPFRCALIDLDRIVQKEQAGDQRLLDALTPEFIRAHAHHLGREAGFDIAEKALGGPGWEHLRPVAAKKGKKA